MIDSTSLVSNIYVFNVSCKRIICAEVDAKGHSCLPIPKVD